MTDTLIICITATICVLSILAVANYRLGQYLNPPVKSDLEALQSQYKAIQSELQDVRNRMNKISIEKGMR